MILFHGGKKLHKHDLIEFASSKKKGRFEYGTGLYSTPNYDWAALYGRYVNIFEVEINSSTDSNNVIIDNKVLDDFVKYNCSRELYKKFCTDIGKKDLSGFRFMDYLLIMHKRFHLISQELNDLFVQCGITHTHSKYKSELFLLHDLKCIKAIHDPKVYFRLQETTIMDG